MLQKSIGLILSYIYHVLLDNHRFRIVFIVYNDLSCVKENTFLWGLNYTVIFKIKHSVALHKTLQR